MWSGFGTGLGEVGDEAPLSRSSGMGHERKWEAGRIGNVLAELGALAEVQDAVKLRQNLQRKTSIGEGAIVSGRNRGCDYAL